MSRAICLIVNIDSGTNARHRDAIEEVLEVFGAGAWIARWNRAEPIEELITRVIEEDGARIVVAAGGDGTAMAVAGALLGRGVPMGVLPLGTFNYFARGLGLSEDPREAAHQILTGHPHDIRVGEVNGRIFLNNASLGIYPSILKERESIYGRWGRSRLAAYWSVGKVFWRYRKALAVRITADGTVRTVRTALLFVARSSYQLQSFGFEGSTPIDEDQFAILVARAHTRRALLRITWHLIRGHPIRGEDYDLIAAREATINTTLKRALVAYDGEKSTMTEPLKFKMAERPLTIVLPETAV